MVPFIDEVGGGVPVCWMKVQCTMGSLQLLSSQVFNSVEESPISNVFNGDKLLPDIFCQKEASNFQAFFKHALKKGDLPSSSCLRMDAQNKLMRKRSLSASFANLFKSLTRLTGVPDFSSWSVLF